MTPAVAAGRFAGSLALGCGLGLWYALVRPLRPRALGEVLFVLALAAAWAELAFRVCQGDIRLGYLAGLYLSAAACYGTIGRLLRPIFTRFWKFWADLGRLLARPVKNFWNLQKKALHLEKNGLQ